MRIPVPPFLLAAALALGGCTPTSTTIGGKVAQSSVLYTSGARTKEFLLPPGYYYPAHTVTGPFIADRDGYHTETIFLSPIGIGKHFWLSRNNGVVRGGIVLNHDPKPAHPRIWYIIDDAHTTELPASFTYKLLPLSSAPAPGLGQALQSDLARQQGAQVTRKTTKTLLRNTATQMSR